MKTIVRILLCCLPFTAVSAFGGDSALIAHGKHLYGGATAILIRAAETMPEEDYGFKPVDTVRTFGQLVGHVADSQYTFCSAALGEQNPALKIEQTRTSKGELVAALREAVAYCDRAYEAMSDESATQPARMMGRESPRLGVLSVNTVHSIEHYGNMVTYLRMRGFVPPTSDPEFMKQLMK